MKLTFVIINVLYSLIGALAQLELSKESYYALKSVLKGRTPVGIQSAKPVLRQLNIQPKEYVILEFDGSGYTKRPADGPRYLTKYLSNGKHSQNVRVRPTYKSYRRTSQHKYNTNVPELKVLDTDRFYSGPKSNKPHSTDVPHKSLKSINFSKQGSISTGEDDSYSFEPIFRNEVDDINPLSKRERTAVKKLVRRSKRQVQEVEETNPDINLLKTLPFTFSTGGSFVVIPAGVKKTQRAKRQLDDESEENPDINFLDTLPFAFSSGGSLLGSTVGRYLDTMNQATFRLTNSLRTLGNLGISQLDAFLDQQDEKRANETTTYN